MASKEELYRTCVRLEARLEVMTQECERLRSQVDKLQDALVAKEAPVAYAEFRRREADRKLTPEQKEEIEIYTRQMDMAKELKEGLDAELPIFRDVDDLRSALIQTIGAPEPEPTTEYVDES